MLESINYRFKKSCWNINSSLIGLQTIKRTFKQFYSTKFCIMFVNQYIKSFSNSIRKYIGNMKKIGGIFGKNVIRYYQKFLFKNVKIYRKSIMNLSIFATDLYRFSYFYRYIPFLTKINSIFVNVLFRPFD